MIVNVILTYGCLRITHNAVRRKKRRFQPSYGADFLPEQTGKFVIAFRNAAAVGNRDPDNIVINENPVADIVGRCGEGGFVGQTERRAGSEKNVAYFIKLKFFAAEDAFVSGGVKRADDFVFRADGDFSLVENKSLNIFF